MRLFSLLVSVTLLCLWTAAQASSAKVMLWSDSKGLIEAEACQKTVIRQGFEEFSDRIVEIESSEASFSFNGTSLSLSGTFWQLAQDSDRIAGISCGLKTYALFEVFVPELLNAVVRVGVSPDEVSLFRTRILHSIDEAEKLISERNQMGSNRLVQQSSQGVKSAAVNSLVEGLDVQNGNLQYVICISNIQLNVRDDSLNKVLFVLNRLEDVKLVQSFGTDRQQKVINGNLVTFVKVQVSSRPMGSNIGWVAESYVQLKSQCAYSKAPVPTGAQVNQWTFPTIKRPSDSYKLGMRRFRAARSGGRLHAACDLYRIQGEQALSVNSGTVIRDRYYFYEGTYAIEVKHSGGRVVRYGEITGKAAPGIGLGSVLSPGQIVGYIGKVNSGCCTPMLHFEMYAGTGKGALTQSGNQFSRRSDLLDPTNDLAQWEKAKFGQSY